MVYKDGFFHGDLHAGNLLILPNNQLGLVDFGVLAGSTGVLKKRSPTCFLALASGDFDRMAYIYIDLAPVTGTIDVDAFASDVRGLLAPYLGLTMKHVNLGRLSHAVLGDRESAWAHTCRRSWCCSSSRSWPSKDGRMVSETSIPRESMAVAKEQMPTAPDSKRCSERRFLRPRHSIFVTTLPRQIKYASRRLNDPIVPERQNRGGRGNSAAPSSGFHQVFWD